MKTNAPKVEHEEALALAAWAESHAHYECNDDYEEWVAKCTRIAEALRQLAALREILQGLAQDENSDVRSWVARHPNATVEILQGLAQDENSGVRYWGCEPEPDPSVKIVDKDHWWYNMI